MLARGASIVALGGDHAVTYPLVRAHAAAHGPLSIVHLGAHPVPAELIRQLTKVPLMYQPGTVWEYGRSTDVLGHLIERLTGEDLDRVLDARIFKPLKMTDTGFWVPLGKQDRVAEAFAKDPEGPAEYRLLQVRYKPSYLAGGQALVSTAHDYLRFCEMLRRGGELDGERLIGPRKLAMMRMNHLPGSGDLAGLALDSFSESAFEGVGFGLGFATTLGEVRAEGLGARGLAPPTLVAAMDLGDVRSTQPEAKSDSSRRLATATCDGVAHRAKPQAKGEAGSLGGWSR